MSDQVIVKATVEDDGSAAVEKQRDAWLSLKEAVEEAGGAADSTSGQFSSLEGDLDRSTDLVQQLYDRLQELGGGDAAVDAVAQSFDELYAQGYSAKEGVDALAEASERLEADMLAATGEIDSAASSLSGLSSEADNAASSVGEVDAALSGLDGQLTSLAQSQGESTAAAEGGRDAYQDVASAATISTARLGAMDKGLIGIAKSFGLAKLTAGGGALAFIEAGMGAAEEEANIARLNATIDANIAVHGDMTEAIAQAEAAGARLAFSDDEVRGSMQRSIPLTKDWAASLEVMSVAMDYARGAGISLDQATRTLLTGMINGGTAFRRQGVDIKESATAIEVLQAVHARYAGQAQAYGNQTAGSFDKAKIAAGELADAIGGPLTGAFDGFFKVTAAGLTAATYGLIDFADFASTNLFDPAAMAAQNARYKEHTQEMWDTIHGIWGDGAEGLKDIQANIGADMAVAGQEGGEFYTAAMAAALDDGITTVQESADAYIQFMIDQQDAFLQAGEDNALAGGEGFVTGSTDTLPSISTAGDDAVSAFDKTTDAGAVGTNMGGAGGSNMAITLDSYQSSVAIASGNLIASANQPKAASAAGGNTGGAFGASMLAGVNDGIARSNAAIIAANKSIGAMGGPLIPLIKPASGGTVAGSYGGGITPQTMGKIINLAPPPVTRDAHDTTGRTPTGGAAGRKKTAAELGAEFAAAEALRGRDAHDRAAGGGVSLAEREANLEKVRQDFIDKYGYDPRTGKPITPKAAKGGGGKKGGAGATDKEQERALSTYNKAKDNLADAQADYDLLLKRVALEGELEAAKDGVTAAQERLSGVTEDYKGRIEAARSEIENLDRAQEALTIGDEIEAASAALDEMRDKTEGLLNPLILQAHQLGEELEDVEAAAETALTPLIKGAKDAQAAADAVTKQLDDLHYSYSQMYQGINDALFELQQREDAELAGFDQGIEQKQAGVTALQDKLDAFYTKEEQRSQQKELEGMGQGVTNLEAQLASATQGTLEYELIQRRLAEAQAGLGAKTEEYSITNELTQKQQVLELAQREREERAKSFQEERAIIEARQVLLEREETLRARPLEAEQRAAQEAVAAAQAAQTAAQAQWDERKQQISDQIAAIEDLRGNIAFDASQRERDQGLIIADLKAKKQASDDYYNNERDRIDAHIDQLKADQEAAEAGAGVVVAAAKIKAEAAAEAIKEFTKDNRLGDAAQKVLDATTALEKAEGKMDDLATATAAANKEITGVKTPITELGKASDDLADGGLEALREELDPLHIGGLQNLFMEAWDFELPRGNKKLFNTSLHEMGVAANLFMDVLGPKFKVKLPEWAGLFDDWRESIEGVNDQLDELASKDIPTPQGGNASFNYGYGSGSGSNGFTYGGGRGYGSGSGGTISVQTGDIVLKLPEGMDPSKLPTDQETWNSAARQIGIALRNQHPELPILLGVG